MAGKEEELKTLEMKFLEKTSMLNATSTKLDQAMNNLEVKKKELANMFEEMKMLEKKLFEQKYISKAHACTEENLDSVASTLAENLAHSLQDIDGLYQKIERKNEMERANMEQHSEFHQKLSQYFNNFYSRICELKSVTGDKIQAMNDGSIQFENEKNEVVRS
jgi:kinesin family member 11